MGRRRWQNVLPWVLAGTFATLLVGFVYFRDSQHEDIAVQEDGVVYQESAPASSASPPAGEPENVQPSVTSNLKPPATNPVPRPSAAHRVLEPGPSTPKPIINLVPKSRPASSIPKPLGASPVVEPEFADATLPTSVTNPVLNSEPASSSLTPSSPAVSRPQSESLSKTAVLSRPRLARVVIGPVPEGLPQVAETPQPGFRYPVVPNRALRGRVSLKAVVGVDGGVKQLAVLNGPPPLVAAAVRAVLHWHYRPYIVGGQAVEVATKVTFNFLGHDVVTITFPAEP